MIGAAISFLAVGVADLVAGGLQGTPVSRRRAVVGIVGALFITLTAGSFAVSTGALLLALAVNVAGVTAWIQLRTSERSDSRRAWVALAALTLYLGFGIGSGSLWQAESVDWLDRWLASLAFPVLRALDAHHLLFLVALFVFLSATANGVVRTVLVASGTETRRSEERLRGGRVIGVLERWMIFGLMLYGEPTAAGLVVSAKSILRFPELTRVAAEPPADSSSRVRNVDHVTEYFLLGSLVSWLLATGLAVLIAG